VKLINETAIERDRLRAQINERDNARAAYETALKRVEQAQQNAGAAILNALPVHQALYIAGQDLVLHRNVLGGLKGFHLAAFGFAFKSRARKAAEQAHAEHLSHETASEQAKRDVKAHELHAERLSNRAKELKQKAELLDRHLRVRGAGIELKEVGRRFEQTIIKNVREIQPEDARQACDDGEITGAELRRFYIEAGYREELDGLGDRLPSRRPSLTAGLKV
jgi:hypothetical protein